MTSSQLRHIELGPRHLQHTFDLVNGSTWPPTPDTPILYGRHGKPVSYFGDGSWNLTEWYGKSLMLSFGSDRTSGSRISDNNAYLLKLISAWWLVGPNACTTASGLYARHQAIKKLFVICTQEGIDAAELSRHPAVIERVSRELAASSARYAVALLRNLWLCRTSLNFSILDESGLSLLASLTTRYHSIQTPYIPPRIWAYQALRLKTCLDDYIEHRKQIEDCFRFCLDAYKKNSGGAYTATTFNLPTHQLPFHPTNIYRPNRGNRTFYGSFSSVAKQFGLYDLLNRWVTSPDQRGITALSAYLSLITQAGLAYIINFTQMRIDEAAQLRTDCLRTERDPSGCEIFLIGGITSKTLNDPDAWWIASPSVVGAVEAMRSVATLRISIGSQDPRLQLSEEDINNPYLNSRVFEPWGPTKTTEIRKRASSYDIFIRNYPLLFDKEELRLTQEDHNIAHQLTFGLDPAEFSVGSIWPLSWHQLRRTGAVNMLSSGLVSETTLQYQLKHSARATSLYYGQNHFKLQSHLDAGAKRLYLKEKHQHTLRTFSSLHAENLVSPYGEKRRSQLLTAITAHDHALLIKSGQAGTVSYKQTFLGGCANPGPPCPFGGFSNISRCMGFAGSKPCEWSLLDKSKLPLIEELRTNLSKLASESDPSSIRHAAIMAQIDSADRALKILNGAPDE